VRVIYSCEAVAGITRKHYKFFCDGFIDILVAMERVQTERQRE